MQAQELRLVRPDRLHVAFEGEDGLQSGHVVEPKL